MCNAQSIVQSKNAPEGAFFVLVKELFVGFAFDLFIAPGGVALA